jgi:hypothetical protein
MYHMNGKAMYSHMSVCSDHTEIFTQHSSLFVQGVQYSHYQWRNRPHMADFFYADQIANALSADPFLTINPAPLR